VERHREVAEEDAVNEALVVMLALIWAIVLLPGAVRSRRANTMATVGGFERAMDVLRRQPDGRYLMVPEDAGRIVGPEGRGGTSHVPTRARREDPIIERRRLLFGRMLVATGVLLLAAVAFRGFAWTLFTLALATTVGYAALLRHLKLRREQVRAVVRELRGDTVIDIRDEQRIRDQQRMPVAVGSSPGVQVASRPDDPWEPMAGVRIRRWED
jgi:hypothetical protein